MKNVSWAILIASSVLLASTPALAQQAETTTGTAPTVEAEASEDLDAAPNRLSEIQRKFDGARLEQMDLRMTNLYGASFRGATLRSLHLEGLRLGGSSFAEGTLEGPHGRGRTREAV